jgi:hypothetical protein
MISGSDRIEMMMVAGKESVEGKMWMESHCGDGDDDIISRR